MGGRGKRGRRSGFFAPDEVKNIFPGAQAVRTILALLMIVPSKSRHNLRYETPPSCLTKTDCALGGHRRAKPSLIGRSLRYVDTSQVATVHRCGENRGTRPPGLAPCRRRSGGRTAEPGADRNAAASLPIGL